MAEGVTAPGRDGATINLLDGVTLTGTLADNESDAYRISPLTQLELALDYTMDAAETSNTANISLLLSEDGVNFHEYSIASDQTPADNAIVSILYPRRFQIEGTAGVKETRWFAVPTLAKYMKIQAQEAGISSNGGIFTAKARVGNDTTYP